MAASIFLSWSSPDKEQVFPLRDRLRAVGLDVWEYSDDLPAGSDIHAEIIKKINQVQLAIICFSDATASNKWIVDETAWCVKTLLDGDRALRHILPVWVGPHPHDLAPAVMKERNLRIANVFGDGEKGLRQFVGDVFRQLGLDAPRIVPAALFAMKRDQCEQLLANGAAPALAQVCAVAGMPSAALVAQTFLERYGDQPEKLAPFVPGQQLLDIIKRTLQDANHTRVLEKKRPVFLRWMRDELVGANANQQARDEWAAGDSLLIVDSVSAFHPEVQMALLQLPQPKRPDRASLLWIPPYTQHMVSLENALEGATKIVAQLGDAFSDWRSRAPDRALAFDTSTPTAMRQWLRRAFLSVEDQADPILDNVSVMRSSSATRLNLAEILPGSNP